MMPKKKTSKLKQINKSFGKWITIYLSNNNKRIVNYAHNSKLKKAKFSEQRKKKGTKRGSNNKREKKKGKVKEYKIYGGKYYGNCWHLKRKYFICHNMRYIIAKCPKKSSNPTSSFLSKKKLCYAQKITCHLISKAKVSIILVLCLVRSCFWNLVIYVIIDSNTTDHFFYN